MENFGFGSTEFDAMSAKDAPTPVPISLPPLYDTSTFRGRFLHFAAITDWRLCALPTDKLWHAQALVDENKDKDPLPSTPEFRQASTIYQSAFHPDTGELQNFVGRMSFQVPGGMMLTGAMLAFYRSTPAVVFWQWANQSFNAFVNYTNRNAASDLSTQQLAVAYTSATTAALTTALGLKKMLAGSARFAVLQRFVPFMAVAAANIANIPLMRQNELLTGVNLQDETGACAGQSKVSAVKGISQVVTSRIIMAAPGMLLLPLLLRRIERRPWFRPAFSLPLQTALCGVSLTLMVPLACALYDQRCSISVDSLRSSEPDLYVQLQEKYGDKLPTTLYFNKGL